MRTHKLLTFVLCFDHFSGASVQLPWSRVTSIFFLSSGKIEATLPDPASTRLQKCPLVTWIAIFYQITIRKSVDQIYMQSDNTASQKTLINSLCFNKAFGVPMSTDYNITIEEFPVRDHFK